MSESVSTSNTVLQDNSHSEMESADATEEGDNGNGEAAEEQDHETEIPPAHQLLLEVFEDGSDDEAVALDGTDDDATGDLESTSHEASGWRWGDGSCQSQHAVEFCVNPGLDVPLLVTAQPLDFLKQFITADMLENIATETNRYAEHILKTASYTSSSRLHTWEPTYVDELWSFLGLLTAMGLIHVDEMSLYWSTDIMYSFPFFSSTMSRDHFQLLFQFLHISNNMDPANRENSLSKIMPFLKGLLKKFQGCYKPRQHLALGEAFISWGGFHAAQNKSENSSARYGVKVYELIDTYNGYCCGFHICDTKKTYLSPGVPSSVVMKLMQPYLNKGYHLYLGTYCDSPALYQELAEKGVLACGPVKGKQNGLGVLSKIKLNQEGDSRFAHHERVNHVKIFIEGKEMEFLTTIHASAEAHSSQVAQAVVEDYNKFMSVLDQYDSITQDSTFKRRNAKWWKKIFLQFISLAQANAYLLYCDVVMETGRRPMNKRLFHREMAKEMVSHSLSGRRVKRKISAIAAVDDLNRLTARHFLSRAPLNEEYATDPSKKKFRYHFCAVCHGLVVTGTSQGRPRRRRETSFECSECGVGLCMIPCFKLYHTERNYKEAYLQLCERGQDLDGE